MKILEIIGICNISNEYETTDIIISKEKVNNFQENSLINLTSYLTKFKGYKLKITIEIV